MKQRILTVLFLTMALFLTGCGQKDADTTPDPDAQPAVDLAACREDMVSRLELTDVVNVETSKLLDLYGIEEEQVSQSACFAAGSGGAFPMEIVMIEGMSEADAEDIQVKLQTRLDNIEEQASSYDPESTALAQNCTVRRDGVYVAMFFSAYEAEMSAIYSGYVG